MDKPPMQNAALGGIQERHIGLMKSEYKNGALKPGRV